MCCIFTCYSMYLWGFGWIDKSLFTYVATPFYNGCICFHSRIPRKYSAVNYYNYLRMHGVVPTFIPQVGYVVKIKKVRFVLHKLWCFLSIDYAYLYDVFPLQVNEEIDPSLPPSYVKAFINVFHSPQIPQPTRELTPVRYYYLISWNVYLLNFYLLNFSDEMSKWRWTELYFRSYLYISSNEYWLQLEVQSLMSSVPSYNQFEIPFVLSEIIEQVVDKSSETAMKVSNLIAILFQNIRISSSMWRFLLISILNSWWKRIALIIRTDCCWVPRFVMQSNKR